MQHDHSHLDPDMQQHEAPTPIAVCTISLGKILPSLSRFFCTLKDVPSTKAGVKSNNFVTLQKRGNI